MRGEVESNLFSLKNNRKQTVFVIGSKRKSWIPAFTLFSVRVWLHMDGWPEEEQTAVLLSSLAEVLRAARNAV